MLYITVAEIAEKMFWEDDANAEAGFVEGCDEVTPEMLEPYMEDAGIAYDALVARSRT